VLPAGTAISLEEPSTDHVDLAPAERLRVVANVTRAFLAAHPQRRDEATVARA